MTLFCLEQFSCTQSCVFNSLPENLWCFFSFVTLWTYEYNNILDNTVFIYTPQGKSIQALKTKNDRSQFHSFCFLLDFSKMDADTLQLIKTGTV